LPVIQEYLQVDGKNNHSVKYDMDGICDHTAGIPDEAIHQHYTKLLAQGDAILYGRITYGLMEFWRTVLDNPSDNKSMNDFTMVIDRIPKIVFSRTLKNVTWKSATIAERSLKEEVLEHRQQPGKDIFVGSRSLIIQLLNLQLIDEFQLCIHPLVEGKGMRLFENINERIIFKLVKNKTFKNGAIKSIILIP
jgi:dihydrofolate reductase